MSARDENPTGVPEAWMSDMGRARGSGVSVWHIGLLASIGETTGRKMGELSGPGVVSSGGIATLICMVAASTSPTEHAGVTIGLSVVERNQVSILTKSASST